jgi:hypothetical protein
MHAGGGGMSFSFGAYPSSAAAPLAASVLPCPSDVAKEAGATPDGIAALAETDAAHRDANDRDGSGACARSGAVRSRDSPRRRNAPALGAINPTHERILGAMCMRTYNEKSKSEYVQAESGGNTGAASRKVIYGHRLEICEAVVT